MHKCRVAVSPINNYNYSNKHQVLKYLRSQLTEAISCILEVPGSNLGQNTNCSDLPVVVVLSESRLANAGTVLQKRP
jgi:hypothetical protein